MNIQHLISLIFDTNFTEAKNFTLHNKPDLNVVSAKGNTPLLCATGTADVDMVEFLLNHGADLNFTDGVINSPLMQAIEISVDAEDYGSNDEIKLNVIQKLLDYGARMDLKDKNGDTPIPYSFSKGYNPAAYLLFQTLMNTKNRSLGN